MLAKTKNHLQTDWILIKDGDDIIARINKADFATDEEAEKIADKIAAAPELLKALTDFYSDFEGIASFIRLGDNTQNKLDECLRVMNALRDKVKDLKKLHHDLS